MIVIDAFVSDAIPMHLLTVEAFRLYLAKLAPGGVICVHTSNRYIDLPPVLADTARHLNLACVHGKGELDPNRKPPPVGMFGSEWVMLARNDQDLAAMQAPGSEFTRWERPVAPHRHVWRDDFAYIREAFRPDMHAMARTFTVLLFALIGLMILRGSAGLIMGVADSVAPRDQT
jgi:hypothetical protein